MSNLTHIQNGLSSLEIAELTGKQHKNVLRDIDNMLDSLEVGKLKFERTYLDTQNKQRKCYNLPKRESLILASGYDVKLRAKIIDRWAELEMTGGFNLPKNMSEALRLSAELFEEKEKAVMQLQQANNTIKENAPLVLFTNAVKGSNSSCLVGELAKIISQNGVNMGQNRLFNWLRNNRYLGIRGEQYNIPNQKYIEQGLFELKKGVRSGSDGVMKTTITPKVTPKGQVYFINKFLQNTLKTA